MSGTRSVVVVGVLTVVLCGVLAGTVPSIAAQESERNVQISATVAGSDPPIVGDSVTVETTVSNLESSTGSVDIDSIVVRDRGTLDVLSRVNDASSVDPGGSVTVPVPTTFDTAGDRLVSVVVYTEDASGTGVDRYEQPLDVDVEEPTVRADLDVSVPSDRFGVADVTVRNVGNVDLTRVTLTASADGETVERMPLDDVERGANRSVDVDTRSVADRPVTFTLAYTANGADRSTTESVDLGERGQVLGAIELTSVETTRTATGVRIGGDAANVGGTDASSVLVRVQDVEGVTPVPPSADYFVGGVDTSEFATFELTAETAPDVSQVPVEITYIVENQRTTRTRTVDLRSTGVRNDADGATPEPDGGSGVGRIPTVVFGVLAVGVVVGAGVYRWRRG